MKRCEQFKDLILTDYIDEELDKDLAGKLERHLLDCGDCRAFLEEVKNSTGSPFQQVPLQEVPLELWDSIKQNIECEDRSVSPYEDLIKKLKELFVYPKIVPVFASLVLMFLVGSVSFNTIKIQQAQAKDQGEYLISLLVATDVSAQADNNDAATPIEHYFL